MADSDTDMKGLCNRLTTVLLTDDTLSLDNKEVVLLKKLQGLVTNVKWTPADATKLFIALLERFEATSTNENLLSWMMKMLHSIEINYLNPSLKFPTGQTVIQLVNDRTKTDENLLKLFSDDTEKTLDEILEEIRQQKLNQTDETLLNEVRDIVLAVAEDLGSPNGGSILNGLKKDMRTLCRAVEKTQSFRPRLTQMVSWCLMALSKSGWLIQVGTGEGKSCIVAMFAAFRALRGEKVDIMSSSPVLAERDYNDWKKFYSDLNISVSCNANKLDGDLKECYKCDVVYGTAEEFAGDWRSQHFHRREIFGQRKFQCAIVDEVDSLMLDKGLYVVYLSSDMPALQHLNPLLALIWGTVNKFRKTDTKTTLGPKIPFHHVVFENLTASEDIDEFTILQMAEDTGTLAKGSVRDIRKNPSLLTEKIASVTATQLADFLKKVEMRFPSCHFVLHVKNNDGTVEEVIKRPQEDKSERHKVSLLFSSSASGFCHCMYSDKDALLSAVEAEVKRVLRFTPCELSQDTNMCYVPGFFKELVTSKLKIWIENAFEAQTMTMGHEYIVEGHGVVPVDYSCTGVVENNMKWSDGLQQFLEMKHQTRLSDISVITNYMSNVGLLQKYGNQIYGISGTIGQQSETETVQKLYPGIETCQIPSFKRRKLFEVEGEIADDDKEWTEKICKVVMIQVSPTPFRGPRAVLVICETINRALKLHDLLKNQVQNQKIYISNNMDNSAIFKKNLEPGDVIIATNLAGRGTDLKVSRQVNSAGGLFVIQTFLPKNARVEQQAFGRTARQGFPGSAQLIMCSEHLPETLQLLILTNNIRSVLEKLSDVTPLYQQHFVLQCSLYQSSQREVLRKLMSSTLPHILTKTSNSGVKIAKWARDKLVADRLSRFLKCDVPQIKKKEELFTHYLGILDDLYKSSGNKPAESDLAVLNETWGMWLLMNFNEEDSIKDLRSRLDADMHKAKQNLAMRESSSSILHHYTLFGNDLRTKGNLEDSIQVYTKAIQGDHCWAAIAQYNCTFAALSQKDGNQDRNCINRALGDLANALKSIEFYCKQIEVTDRYSTQERKKPLSNLTCRFNKHIAAKFAVFEFFKENISQAIEKLEIAKDKGRSVKVTKQPVYFMAPLWLLLPFGILNSQSLTLVVSKDIQKMQQLINDPSFDIFRELMCLKSLGLTHVYALDTVFSLTGLLSKIF